MESRKIRVANTQTQRRYEVMTDATTLAELKAAFDAECIPYSGMTFTEGITKTELLRDDSVLPTNVMYKGQPTNELVILLTNTKKNISSGAMDRKEAFRLIKEMGLQDTILEGEGKNYTLVKTDILEEYINDNDGFEGLEEEEVEEDEIDQMIQDVEESKPSYTPTVKVAPHADLVELVYLGVKYLTKTHNMIADDVAVIADLTTELYKRLRESEPKISDDDIDEMIASI